MILHFIVALRGTWAQQDGPAAVKNKQGALGICMAAMALQVKGDI